MKSWNKVMIDTPHGSVSGVAPVIISASRATDIPAFYSDWFFDRLKVGYLKWINPFNRQAQYVSFSEARVIVFWSKNPKPMLQRIEALEKRGINFYFTITVNDYVQQKLEEGLPSLAERLETFKSLSERIGKERTIWRFDPLLLTEEMGVTQLLEKIERVGEKLHPFTEQLVISFADIEGYAKVRSKLARNHVYWKPFNNESVQHIAQGLQQLNSKWGLQVKTCGETYDLSAYGITHSSCIDGELMKRLFPNDRLLLKFLGVNPCDELSLFPDYDISPATAKGASLNLKDPGQRLACGCIMSKDIGQYDTCTHQCLYCYANTSNSSAMKNWHAHDKSSESIIPG